VDRIISLAEAGASQTHPVVLMHNQPPGNPATVAALPTIIRFYRDRGYSFVDLNGRVADRPPFGSFDTARADGTGHVSVRGWTVDPDTLTAPTRVHVYVDGRGTSVLANGPRPDVAAVYPAAGPLHGFTAAVQVGPGNHTLCVFAIDTFTSSVHPALGCRTVTVRPALPVGTLDSAQAHQSGSLAVRGWTIDRDTPTISTRVHVYVDGHGTSVAADKSRPDVAAAYPGAGPLHGFRVSVPVDPGAHSVCVYAIDTSFTNLHSGLGCRTVTTR
jgi:hypothetical protein